MATRDRFVVTEWKVLAGILALFFLFGGVKLYRIGHPDYGDIKTEREVYDEAPWEASTPTYIVQAIAANGIHGCGELGWKRHPQHRLTVLIACRRYREDWRGYIGNLSSDPAVMTPYDLRDIRPPYR